MGAPPFKVPHGKGGPTPGDRRTTGNARKGRKRHSFECFIRDIPYEKLLFPGFILSFLRKSTSFPRAGPFSDPVGITSREVPGIFVCGVIQGIEA